MGCCSGWKAFDASTGTEKLLVDAGFHGQGLWFRRFGSVELCARTLPAPKVCMLLSEHRCFVRCEGDGGMSMKNYKAFLKSTHERYLDAKAIQPGMKRFATLQGQYYRRGMGYRPEGTRLFWSASIGFAARANISTIYTNFFLHRAVTRFCCFKTVLIF